MVFNPNPAFFPQRTVEQSSPLGGLLSGVIAQRLAMAKMQKEESLAPLARLIALSKANSENAYSNAVFPQFQAKLLGVPGAVGSLQHPQSTLNALENYGTTGNTGNNGNNFQSLINQELANQNNKTSSGNGILGTIGQGLKNLFLGNNEEQQNAAPTQQTPNMAVSPQPQNQGYSNQTQASVPTNQPPSNRSPESQAWTENEAQGKKVVNKGASQGTAEGTQQAAYGPKTASIVDQQQSSDYLKDVFKNPIIQKIADVPFASQYSIAWYKQNGTQEQKIALGELTRAMNDYVSSSLGMFGSRATDLDVKFLKDDLKPSDKDTMAVRQGKLIGAETYINGKANRIQLAEQYMGQGMTQTQAEFKAAKEIDLNKIRKQAYNDIASYENKENKENKESSVQQANNQGYTQTMWTPPDPKTGLRRKALVHSEDVDKALSKGWTNG